MPSPGCAPLLEPSPRRHLRMSTMRRHSHDCGFRRPSSITVAVLLFSLGCSSAGADRAVRMPDELHMASGNDQRGVVGAPLPEPIVVKLMDRRGKPVVDHLIAFEVV